jgi:hypothetical protein
LEVFWQVAFRFKGSANTGFCLAISTLTAPGNGLGDDPAHDEVKGQA